LNVGKIGAIAGRVSCDERPVLHLSMRTDVEIREWRGLRAAAASLPQIGLRREPTGAVRQRQSYKDCRIKPSVQIGDVRKSRCQFRINDRVDKNRSLCRSLAKLHFGPWQPYGICGGYVQQDVCVEKTHSSSRVRAITFAVVMLGIPAPRALCSQRSTGGDVPRLNRSDVSQRASSSTWGAGNFSMALSISAMLFIGEI
jgi:hypothetical protein